MYMPVKQDQHAFLLQNKKDCISIIVSSSSRLGLQICSHNGSVFSVEPPLFVELEITETEPGFKGDTATGASKPATVETGATVAVPLFVNQGDKIKIDTRTGEYLSRA